MTAIVDTRPQGGNSPQSEVPFMGSAVRSNRPSIARKSLDWKQIERPIPIPGSVLVTPKGLVDAYSGKMVEGV